MNNEKFYYTDDKYILDAQGNPVPEHNLYKWAEWFEDAQKTKARVLARTEVGPYYVSTVFLAMSYQFSGGPPLLWETMTFEKKTRKHKDGFEYNKEMDDPDINGFNQYTTKEEALAGHEEIVKQLQDKYGKKGKSTVPKV